MRNLSPGQSSTTTISLYITAKKLPNSRVNIMATCEFSRLLHPSAAIAPHMLICRSGLLGRRAATGATKATELPFPPLSWPDWEQRAWECISEVPHLNRLAEFFWWNTENFMKLQNRLHDYIKFVRSLLYLPLFLRKSCSWCHARPCPSARTRCTAAARPRQNQGLSYCMTVEWRPSTCVVKKQLGIDAIVL